MTEKDNFTLDNPIMFDKKNGRCRCIPIPYEKDMTEKRYNVCDVDGTIFLEDHKEGSYHIGLIGNVDINCLNDIANRLNDLNDENEKLKSTINTLTHDNTKMKKVLNTTKNENEHIKQVIKEAYHNERTHIGKNVLKQLLEAIQ